MAVRTIRLALALLCGAFVVSGCAGAVRVSPQPVASNQPGCPAVLAELPKVVSDAKRRGITPSDASAAAWGRTPIVLTCGVPRPRALTPTSELLTVNGVDWLSQTLSSGVRFTLVSRTPRVQVDVPKQYSPEINALVDLSDAIKKTTEVTPAL